jgi:D-sedoheptulose 7-phosphate isomerase
MIVFTNGCFDVLHRGHVDLLTRARALGSRLVVGLNSDASVRQIKGPERPFQNQEDRKAVLMGLKSVDEVIIFDELTPEYLIQQVKPDVLVKGGDWSPSEIIGSDFVSSYGGKVLSLPLVDGYSSTAVLERMSKPKGAPTPEVDAVSSALDEHLEVFGKLSAELAESIRDCGRIIVETVRSGGKILVCGNGGSAADAQHLAAEFVGRYETERKALPAIALTTDTSALTAISNDYSFENVFKRQVEALANEGDCLIGISTSGNSPNIVQAVMEARRKGCRIIGLSGAKGKKLASLSDACILVPSERTARIQEAHITIAHIWCRMVDESYA